jgi:hypothetical protein
MPRGISEIGLENGICVIIDSSMSVFRHAVEMEALLSARKWSAARCVRDRSRCLSTTGHFASAGLTWMPRCEEMFHLPTSWHDTRYSLVRSRGSPVNRQEHGLRWHQRRAKTRSAHATPQPALPSRLQSQGLRRGGVKLLHATCWPTHMQRLEERKKQQRLGLRPSESHGMGRGLQPGHVENLFMPPFRTTLLLLSSIICYKYGGRGLLSGLKNVQP